MIGPPDGGVERRTGLERRITKARLETFTDSRPNANEEAKKYGGVPKCRRQDEESRSVNGRYRRVVTPHRQRRRAR